jgi:hypothetical protein
MLFHKKEELPTSCLSKEESTPKVIESEKAFSWKESTKCGPHSPNGAGSHTIFHRKPSPPPLPSPEPLVKKDIPMNFLIQNLHIITQPSLLFSCNTKQFLESLLYWLISTPNIMPKPNLGSIANFKYDELRTTPTLS